MNSDSGGGYKDLIDCMAGVQKHGTLGAYSAQLAAVQCCTQGQMTRLP
jgi:hypothetical protein